MKLYYGAEITDEHDAVIVESDFTEVGILCLHLGSVSDWMFNDVCCKF